MSQAFYPTNDGHIGNLEKLSLPELLELIQRQEKLLKKKNFLKTLADKGEKIAQHLHILNQELQRRKQTSDRRTIRNANNNIQTHENNINESVDENIHDRTGVIDPKSVSSIDGQGLVSKSVSGMDEQGLVSSITDSAANRLEKDFEKLQVQENSDDSSVKTKHQYEIALERAEQHSKEPKKGHQRLNRNIHITHVEELPANLINSKPSPSLQKKTASKNVQEEESAAMPPKYRYDEVKVIPLDESLKLQVVQKQKQEELQARMAAEKLSQRLGVKMEEYNPEGIDMSYRNRKTGLDGVDSDDDDEQEEAGVVDILTSDTED